jgi:hypothetical protein
MPGYGAVSVGAFGAGGMAWSSDAALALDFWVSGLPAGALADVTVLIPNEGEARAPPNSAAHACDVPFGA